MGWGKSWRGAFRRGYLETISRWCLSLVLVGWIGIAPAQAETLTDRLAIYPNWQHPATTEKAQGDLYYPSWIAGTWQLKTTLIDLVAPLAPAIVTPGFDSNREFLNQPIEFVVRFIPAADKPKMIIADRAFNGLNIAKAYLGETMVRAVKVDPRNPNRQITMLKGDRQLESTITDRAVETPDPTQFVTTERFQQIFRGTDQPYLNQVETTTAYRYQTAVGEGVAPMLSDRPKVIVADQVTAIYLSPHDVDYFKAGEIPVALYRYKLEFFPFKT
jgi:hypothetical protein